MLCGAGRSGVAAGSAGTGCGVEGGVDLMVDGVVLAAGGVGVGGEQDAGAVAGAGGDLGGRGSGVEPGRQGGVAQVIGAAGQAGGEEAQVEGAGAGVLPGPAVDGLGQDPAALAGEQPAVRRGAVDGEVAARRVMRSGGIGTVRTACSGRCLRPRSSWPVPFPVQAAAVRGAVLDRMRAPMTWPC
jgi:hypothetical protein